jgi:hypothetical protein
MTTWGRAWIRLRGNMSSRSWCKELSR